MIDAALGLLYRVALLVREAGLMLWRPQTVGVRVLVLRQGPAGQEVLLVRHRAGRLPWELPGGAVGRGEPLVEAARREVREEAGTTVRVEQLHAALDNFQGRRSDTVVVLVATPLSELRPPRYSLEIAEARYFRLDRLPTTLGPGSRNCIMKWEQGMIGFLGAWVEE